MKKRDPFKYFNTSKEIIRPAVMLHVRFWWHRFGPIFAAEIRKRRVEGIRSSHWRWHLDEMFASVHASAFNHFNSERSLSSRVSFRKNRTAALAEWRGLCAA